MPVILGIDLEDAASTALADASAVALGEPNLDFSTVVNQANYVLAGAGAGILADIGGAVVQAIVSTLLGGDAGAGPVATLDDLVPIVDAIGYGNPPVGSVNADLSAILAYLTSQFGTLAGSIDDLGGADSRDLTEVYNRVPADFAGVWTALLPNSGSRAGDVLDQAGTLPVILADIAAIPIRGNPCFGVVTDWWDTLADRLNTVSIACDWSDYNPGESLLTWLNRVTGWSPWTKDTGSDYYHFTAQDMGIDADAVFYFMLSEVQWNAIINPTATGNAPPVWPGADAVTLGTPVVVTGPTVITGPMDGLLWETTSAPAGRSRFVVNTNEYAYHAGSVAFMSDNGDIEPYQYIGWDHGLFTPRQMNQAASALVAPGRDVTGVATPWAIT